MTLLTLSTERAHVNLTNPRGDSFKLAVSFRPTTPKGVVASGYVDIFDTRSEWEVRGARVGDEMGRLEGAGRRDR